MKDSLCHTDCTFATKSNTNETNYWQIVAHCAIWRTEPEQTNPRIGQLSSWAMRSAQQATLKCEVKAMRIQFQNYFDATSTYDYLRIHKKAICARGLRAILLILTQHSKSISSPIETNLMTANLWLFIFFLQSSFWSKLYFLWQIGCTTLIFGQSPTSALHFAS